MLNLVKAARPHAGFVAVDFSPVMLTELKNQFTSDSRVSVVAHDLNNPLPDLGHFDAVVSSFAIHHLPHDRKRTLYGEVFHCLNSSGIFFNLEHVASPTARLHGAFLDKLDIEPSAEDPSNKLLDLEIQLSWLREIGFVDVDCLWKWRELALIVGNRPV